MAAILLWTALVISDMSMSMLWTEVGTAELVLLGLSLVGTRPLVPVRASVISLAVGSNGVPASERANEAATLASSCSLEESRGALMVVCWLCDYMVIDVAGISEERWIVS